jgi:hypothetical protein
MPDSFEGQYSSLRSNSCNYNLTMLYNCRLALLKKQHFNRSHSMEAEQLNLIANRLTDLKQRNLALRGYL